MRYELRDKPDFSVVHLAFDQAGESVVVEASSMVARDPGIQMKTSMSGGLGSALKRKLLGGESLFQNTFTATAPGQTIWLAPAPEGDLEVLELNGQMPIFLNSGAFLAAGSGVKLDTQWGGAKGFFSGTGFFLLRADGQGPLFFSAYGGIHAIDVGPAGYICDTGSIVGFTGGLQYQVQKVGGLKSLFFSGEGLVCRFSGQGRLWVSTRSPASLAAFLHPFRRVERSND